MQHSQFVVAAALLVLPLEVLAESHLLQDVRRSPWTVLAERPADNVPNPPAVSPDNAEFGWLRSIDLKPGGRVQLELDKDWSVCADWDRQRPKIAPLRETIDTFLLGLYYRF